MFRTFRTALLILLSTLVLCGCRTTATVNVRSDAKGAGVIGIDLALDRDATLGLGTGNARLLTGDLAAAGWAVGRLEPADAGGSTIHAEKAFANVGQANAVLRELTGTDGPLSSLRLTRKQTLVGSSVALEGNVDLRSGLGSFGDAQLKALTGASSNLGIDDAEVARQAGDDVSNAFRFALSAHLIDASKRWDVKFGTRQSVALVAKRFAYQALVGLAAVVLSLTGLVVLLASRRKQKAVR